MKMESIKNLCYILIIAGMVVSCNKTAEDKRPNIIIIMADDMGYSDLGCYGGEINTPNIDYLAKNGLRFSEFHNSARCCPTRASLLTGLYNQQAGIGSMTRDQHEPGYRGYLTENTVTIAEVLKQAGYQTGMVGKWHVSNTKVKDDPQEQLNWLNHQASYPEFSPVDQYPLNRGFDKFYGTIWGVVDHFDPFSLVNGTKPVTDIPANYYHTDAINDTASAYVRQFSKKDAPFFMYVAHNAPHWPVQALPEDIEKYKDIYKVGWRTIREGRYKRMVELGLIDPKTQPLSPPEAELDWQNNPDSLWDARVMAVHAAMIDRMDQGIGRIINSLKETGELENTLIFFLSDNGASPELAHNLVPGFDRPGETRTAEKIIYPEDKKVMPGPETVYASIGPKWANVANTPYRYWKKESYEGGARTPLIAFWPGGITRKTNSINHQLGHVMDFMATCVDIADAKYPDIYKDNSITPAQGISMVPVLKGKEITDRVIFNEHAGGRSVRSGKWKLVKLSSAKSWHLYDMQKDGTELNDLAKEYPEKVEELKTLWDDWAHADNVLPKPGK